MRLARDTSYGRLMGLRPGFCETCPSSAPSRVDRGGSGMLVVAQMRATSPGVVDGIADRVHCLAERGSSPSDAPRCDRPSCQISEFSPNSPDHALPFTAIRASERFRGRVALPALSGPLPRSAVTNARARNTRHDAPRRPPGPPRQATKRPTSTSRRALNSPSWT